MIKRHSLYCYFAILFLIINPANAKSAKDKQIREYTPPQVLNFRSQNPIYLQFPNITPMRSSAIPKGHHELQTSFAYSNIFEKFVTKNHNVRIDFEQLRIANRYRRGLGNDFTLEVEVPFVNTNSGFLDPFVQWFHNFFNFPNGGRESVANNQHEFRMTDRTSNSNIFNTSKVPFALGDIGITLRHSTLVETKKRPGIGWFFTLELPTGKRSRGLGNGELDYGLGLLLEKQSESGRWHGFTNLGYFVSGGQKDLARFTRDEYLSYVVGGSFHVSNPISLHAQIHGGISQLKNMKHENWDGPPLDLIFGVSGFHEELIGGRNFTWQVGFAEDLYPNGPSIDFTTQINFGISLQKSHVDKSTI